MRLLAGKAVEPASSTHAILKKNDLQPPLKRQGCTGQVNGTYLRRLETLLTRYARPYDPQFPAVCFDERPCFLLVNVVEGLAPQPAQPDKVGQPAKQHYACSKHGSCCVLAAVEPLTGQRLYQVQTRRTKRE